MYTKDNPLVIKTREDVVKNFTTINELKDVEGAVVYEYLQGGDPPPADPPQDPPPADPPANPPVFNTDEWLQKEIGEGTTVTSILELKSKYSSLEQRARELEEIAMANVNPFADEEIAKINEFVKKTGVRDLGVAQTVLTSDKLSNLSFEDAIVLQKRLSGIDLPEADLRNAVRQEFGYNDADGEPRYERDALLKVTGTEAKKALSKIAEDVKLPETTAFQAQMKEARARQQQELMTKWDNDLRLMQHKPPTFVAKYGEKENEVATITIPGEYIAERMDIFKNQIAQEGMAVSPEAIAKLENTAAQMYKLEKFDQILKSTVAAARAEIEREYAGGTPPNRQNPPGGDPKLSGFDVIKGELQKRGQI